MNQKQKARRMKNKQKDIEPLKRRVIAELEKSYGLGYCDGIKDGNINTHTFKKKVQEAYNNGLNDAWECAKKIYGFSCKELSEVLPESKEIPFCSYSASEAIAKIKEYEEQQKQDTKEKIKVGDEVINGGVTGVVTYVEDIENGMKAFAVMDKTGKEWIFNDLVIKRTGRVFPQITEVLKLL